MLENDVQLISRVLSGDDAAFSTLVEKHQKGIHALVWRKIGDFHHAEEITQDTFIQAYRKLGTLKDPKCFSGWLYVIANRLSLNWLQRRKSMMSSLEDIPVVEIEESSYEHYMSEQRETETAEHRSEAVKKLLARLPESERTVVTLHYLGEMTAQEISKYLGVSVSAIKGRLHRGRERLKASESLVREVLGGVQLSTDLTARIMQQVADMTPVSPPGGKPVLPWAAFGTAIVLVMLIYGMSSQYLARFQKPYSFEAESEPTIEIVDVPIVLNVESKPAVRNQPGHDTTPQKTISAGTQISDTTSASVTLDDSTKFSTAQWTQGNAPPGGDVSNIFAAVDGTVLAISPTGMYRFAADDTAWTRLKADIPIDDSFMPIAEHENTLYIVTADEIFTSKDSGETWNPKGSRPSGDAVGLVITDATQAQPITVYLALQDEGVFRTIDGQIQWDTLNDGFSGERISAIAAVENTVFVGTNRGLYRLDLGIWKKLEVDTSKAVYSLAVSENNLYVGMGPDLQRLDSGIFEKIPTGGSESVYSLAVFNNNLYVETGPDPLGLTSIKPGQVVPKNQQHSFKIFYSADFGASWTEIMHIDKPDSETEALGITVLAAGETILALGATHSRSIDGGHTWTHFRSDPDMHMISRLPVVAVNERTFYKAGEFGIHRTTDSGGSWHLFMDGMVGTRTNSLVVFNNRLYAYNGYEVYQSTDEGRSWKNLSIAEVLATQRTTFEPSKLNKPHVYTSFDSKLMVDGNILYFVSPESHILRIYRLFADSNTLIPVQVMPTFDDEVLSPAPEKEVNVKAIVVSNNVFYAEYRRRLFKWKVGDPKWIDTGLVNISKQSNEEMKNSFKLAASGDTVYVGKQDGQLFQSLDGGNNWRDITTTLPLRFTYFNEILFVGSTIYVATDAGVLTSHTGEHWRVIADKTGTRVVMDKFAADGSKIYSIGDTGLYHLDNRGKWEQISPSVADNVVSIVINNNSLYIATEHRGMFHISLDKKSYNGASRTSF